MVSGIVLYCLKKIFSCKIIFINKKPPGKGTWLIILGAGSESGWIPNTTLIFRSKKIQAIIMTR